MVKNIINAAVALIVLGVAIYVFAPGIWTKIETTGAEKLGWTEDAKRRDPVRYLEHIITKTRNEYGKIDSYIAEYRTAIRRLEKERAKASKKSEAAERLLDELKSEYKKVESGEASWPITFRGGNYNQQQFKTQVGTLLTEKNAQSGVVDKLTRRIDALTKKLDKIRSARVEYASKVSVLEADLAVAKANVGSAELDDLIGKADEILAYVDETATDLETPLRTTDELLESESEGEKSERSEEIDAFLSQ